MIIFHRFPRKLWFGASLSLAMFTTKLFTLLFALSILFGFHATAQSFDVLVFTKTAGWRHASISDGIGAIYSLGVDNSFSATITEHSADFTDQNLSQFQAVVFLNTTGDVLNALQQAAFERYIQNGGGYVGVHAASDCEYGWAWYGQLLGAYFSSHPAIQSAMVEIEDNSHISTRDLPSQLQRTDEWYNFQSNPRGEVNVLATVDESTYTGGAMGLDHPISWYHEFDGGRAWYTGMGHTSESFSEPEFLSHLLGGILYAAGVEEGPSSVKHWNLYE